MHMIKNEKKRKHQAKGFTLIELLVVLTILGLIVGLVGPQIMKHLGTAKSDTARLQIEDLGSALDMLYLEIGRYPTTDEGLEALIQNPADLDNWNGPYLKKKKIPKDPWGNEFEMRPGERGWRDYEVRSWGPDGKPDTDDDIGSRTIKSTGRYDK